MIDILTSTKDMDRSNWLAWRNKGIGGSDVATITGLNKYKSALELWMEKVGSIEPKEAGEAAYWGNIMEPIIRNEFMIRTGLKVDTINSILRHPKHKFMLANVDGIVNDPIHGKCIFEAKTASAYKQDLWKDDSIPEEYMLHIQHYMAVTGYSKTYIAVLIGGNTFVYKCIDRDDELIDMILKLELDFWNCVVNTTPPAIDGSESCSNLLNQLFPNANTGNTITLPMETKELIDQLNQARDQEKHYGEIKDEAINKLKAILGDNECGVIGDITISWKNVITERFNSKKLKEELPDIYIKFLNSTSSRRFTIK